jgi:type IV pilus assembly protein PilA
MKTDFQTKFLQHLLNKKDNAGFTLIELLVVIIIIGILSAIALPSFLNQANKARQSEAKTYVGSINRAQQAFFLENSSFAGSVEELGIGVKTLTTYYKYTVEETTPTKFGASATAESLQPSLKPYIGAVQVIQGTKQVGSGTNTTNQEATTIAVLCENKAPKLGKTALGAASVTSYSTTAVATTEIACAGDTKSIQ